VSSYEALTFPTQAAWERWLERNHATAGEIWVRVARKGSGLRAITHAEAVESALCFGWIDSQARRLDDQSFVQRFTRRSRPSPWSAINRERALELIRQGRMRPAGLAEVERARTDGRWEAGR
jgi:uncharacterized protein YdeI (YjbR/CyaY-like superfamily)